MRDEEAIKLIQQIPSSPRLVCMDVRNGRTNATAEWKIHCKRPLRVVCTP